MLLVWSLDNTFRALWQPLVQVASYQYWDVPVWSDCEFPVGMGFGVVDLSPGAVCGSDRMRQGRTKEK